MKSVVLIVDDNVESVDNLKEGLLKLNQFEVVTAHDGQQAIDILERQRISLLVTDIKMPRVDGLELLAYMTKNHSTTPCIVMTGYGTPEMRQMINSRGVLQYIEKPFDFRKLALAIIEGLHLLDEGASMKGMTLRTFLPLVELTKKTCRVEVTSAGRGKGYFYFDQGELREAHYQSMRGDQAALEMLGWESMEIRFNALPQGRARGRITRSLMDLLVEPAVTESAPAPSVTDTGIEAVTSDFTVEPDQAPPQAGDIRTPARPSDNESPVLFTPVTVDRRAFEAALGGHLETIKSTKGYQAVAILNFVGEIMAADTAEPGLPLRELGTRFTDLFRVAHEAATEEGVGECREITIHGADRIILIASSGLAAKVRFYLMGIVDADGNWYYLERKLGEIAAQITAEIS